jgi:LPXTG-motif cell wall-anchored protein
MLAVAALVVLVPGAAVAQDAGSSQYQDPLGGNTGGGGNHGGNGGGNGGSSHVTPATATQTETAQANTGSSQPTQAAQANGQLPATGMDTWLLALGGAGMLLTGLGLRRMADYPSF